MDFVSELFSRLPGVVSLAGEVWMEGVVGLGWVVLLIDKYTPTDRWNYQISRKRKPSRPRLMSAEPPIQGDFQEATG